MSDVVSGRIAPFNGEKVFAVSPAVQYNPAKNLAPNSLRQRFEASVMLVVLLDGMVLKADEEFIQITHVMKREDEDKSYWGGDAILVTIASFHTGEQLSKALQQDDVLGKYDFVVFDRAEGKYFNRGREFDLLEGLAGPPANDPAP